MHLSKKQLIITIVFWLFLISLIIILLLRQPPASNLPTTTTVLSPSPISLNLNQSKTKPLPKASFDDYQLTTTIPTINQPLAIYYLKSNFKDDEIISFANKLGITNENKRKIGSKLVISDANSKSFLSFDSKSGGFFFYSQSGYKISSPSNQPVIIAKLSNLAIGEIQTDDPKDSDIVFDSNGQAGYRRPNDFNTITVAVNQQDYSVAAATSNLRQIKQVNSQPELSTIPASALTNFNQDSSVISFVKPSGSGNLNLNQVFAGNTAKGSVFSVNDFIIGYLQWPMEENQSALIPYYVIKGKSQLNSGYDVEVVQIMPMVKQEPQKQILAVTVVEQKKSSTIKYGTFKFRPSLTPILPIQLPTPTITIMPPTIKPPTPTQETCPPFQYTYQLPNGGTVAIGTGLFQGLENNNYIFYLPKNNDDDFEVEKLLSKPEYKQFKDQIEAGQDRQQVITQLLWLALTQYLYGVGIDQYALIQYCTPFNSGVCLGTGFKQTTASPPKKCIPINATSPNIYIYQKKLTTIIPKNIAIIAYANPALIISKSTLPGWYIKGGDKLNKIYYEYDKTQLLIILNQQPPQRYWFISKASINQWLENIADRLKLTIQESNDLNIEINREIANIQSQYVKISIIDQRIINQILPMSISPTPDNFYRLHFLIESREKKLLSNEPKLDTVSRYGNLVLEIGVITDN